MTPSPHNVAMTLKIVWRCPLSIYYIYAAYYKYTVHVKIMELKVMEFNFPCVSTLTVVNVSRNGRGALYKPLKLLTLKTRKIHLNRPFKVLYSLQLLTDKPYMQ